MIFLRTYDSELIVVIYGFILSLYFFGIIIASGGGVPIAVINEQGEFNSSPSSPISASTVTPRPPPPKPRDSLTSLAANSNAAVAPVRIIESSPRTSDRSAELEDALAKLQLKIEEGSKEKLQIEAALSQKESELQARELALTAQIQEMNHHAVAAAVQLNQVHVVSLRVCVWQVFGFSRISEKNISVNW